MLPLISLFTSSEHPIFSLFFLKTRLPLFRYFLVDFGLLLLRLLDPIFDRHLRALLLLLLAFSFFFAAGFATNLGTSGILTF